MKKLVAILLAFMMLLAFSCKQASSVESGTPSEPVTPPAEPDTTPPAPVTNVQAVTSDCQITLSWENPADEDFAKVKIVFDDDDKTVEVEKPEKSKVIKNLTNDIEYTFKLYAIDTSGNESTVAEKNATPSIYPLEGQGETAKEKIKILEKEYENTKEIVIIPKGKRALICMPDDSAWKTYYSGSEYFYTGAFLSGRNIQLNPFAMSAYEVTQELYKGVMGENLGYFSSEPEGDEQQEYRPVESVTFFKTIEFCNELTKLTMSASDCVYYSDADLITPYKVASGSNVFMDINKKGYRLPTETEWEFAARGGNPTKQDWKYAYGVVQATDSKIYDNEEFITIDNALNDYAWYKNTSNEKTHQVGKKLPNRLGIYDMAGNVAEQCWDWFNSNVAINDLSYVQAGIVIDPLGPASPMSELVKSRVLRGGSWGGGSSQSTVSSRVGGILGAASSIGIRLVRSL